MSMSNKNILTKLILMICLTGLFNLPDSAYASPFDNSRPSFMKKDKDYKRLMGITAGVGKIETEESEQGVSIYGNLFMFWFNLSAEYQSFDNRTATNTYTGVGLGRYFQLQYGYGDEGYIVRARSEFEIVGKFTVFISRERYRDKPVFDNYSAGIGYNF